MRIPKALHLDVTAAQLQSIFGNFNCLAVRLLPHQDLLFGGVVNMMRGHSRVYTREYLCDGQGVLSNSRRVFRPPGFSMRRRRRRMRSVEGVRLFLSLTVPYFALLQVFMGYKMNMPLGGTAFDIACHTWVVSKIRVPFSYP